MRRSSSKQLMVATESHNIFKTIKLRGCAAAIRGCVATVPAIRTQTSSPNNWATISVLYANRRGGQAQDSEATRGAFSIRQLNQHTKYRARMTRGAGTS